MGQYKVPQNVEAEDKIIGPLTLKQFIYAVIGVAWAGLCYGIFRTVIPIMIVVAVPPTTLLLLLAFYKRDGQDFEHFLIALATYVGQSRRRLWIKEEVVSAFKLVPPKITSAESQRNPAEIRSQLDRLAIMMDSRGGATMPATDSSQLSPTTADDRIYMPSTTPTDTITEPEQPDILDQSAPGAEALNQLIADSTKNLRTEALQQLQSESQAPAPKPKIEQAAKPQPILQKAAETTSAMTAPVSGDIIRLATENDDLKVSQIAAQAGRIAPLAEGQSVTLRNEPNKPS